MASVTVQKDPRNGSYFIQIYKDGKRPKFYYGKGSVGKKTATDKAKELNAQIHDANFKLRPKTEQKTVKDVGTAMWAEAGDKTNSTVAQYRRVAEKHVYPELGDKLVSDVTYDDVVKRENAFSRYAPKTAAHYKLVFRMILLEAVRQGLIAKAPATAKSGFKTKKSGAANDNIKRIKALSMDSLLGLLDALDAFHGEDIRYRAFWKFMAWTGVRVSEGIAVKWADFDFDAERVLIERAAAHDEGFNMTGPTKSGLSRWVDLSDELVEVLQALQEAFPDRRGNDWVFFTGDARSITRFTYDVVQQAMKDTVTPMKFKHRVTPHILRHTYASLLLGESKPITYVSDQLGHAHPGITLKIYSHFIPKLNEKPVNILDTLRASSTHAVRTQTGKTGTDGNANIRRIK